MAKDKNILPISIERLTELYNLPHLDNDLLLIDSLHALPVFNNARRMSLCLFIGICTSGVVTLNVNGKRRA